MIDKLDTCGCCEGEDRLTPVLIYNRPGLAALAYRAGTHAEFFETMIADLARHEVVITSVDEEGNLIEQRFRPLQALKTRSRDDFSIALLDAWATVADVLTFYQERIANEGLLRTATERRSILEMARLVGYELAPGVAATTFLTFTVDESKGVVVVPKGTRANSVPEPGEIMQGFETIAEIEARSKTNDMALRLAQPQFLRLPDVEPLPARLYLPGQRNDVQPPARLLLAFGETGLNETFAFPEDGGYFLARVKASDLLDGPARTRVEIEADVRRIANPDTAPRELVPFLPIGSQPSAAYLAEPWANRVGAIVRSTGDLTLSPANVVANAANQDSGFQGAAALNSRLAANIYEVLDNEVAPLEEGRNALRAVVVLRTRAHLHGHMAPWRGFSVEIVEGPVISITTGQVQRVFETMLAEWDDQANGDDGYQAAWGVLFRGEADDIPALAALDGVYDQIAAGSLVVLEWREFGQEGREAPRRALYSVVEVDQVGTGLFNLAATVTRLALSRIVGDEWQPATMGVIRSTVVYGASEIVRNPLPHRVLDVEPAPVSHTVQPNDGWDEVAAQYGLSADMLAAANGLTPQVGLPPTLLLPVGQVLELDGVYRDLRPGRWVALRGMRADIPVEGQEVALIESVEHRFVPRPLIDPPDVIDLPGDIRHTFVTLTREPSLPYLRAAVRISANVVKATHGETVPGIPPRDKDVILGSGDATQPHQSFPLRIQPEKRLTYLPAANAAGIDSTLEVYVGDVRWQERETLIDAGPTEHVYTVHTDDDGLPTVILGDGVEGARAPTGRDNVWARYRVGIGKAGNVNAGQISLLATRPAGVKEVKNWVPATGGADPESRDQARRHVPMAARTLDRLVGLQDYQDFAQTFAGIAKARATWDPLAVDGEGRVRGLVTVHVAGQDNIPLAGSDLLANLQTALDDHDGSNVLIAVAEATARLISVDVCVYIAADRLWERVQPAVRAALEFRFDFDRRELGQDVELSELVEVIHSVPGVTHVQVTRLAALTAADLLAQAADPQPNAPAAPVLDRLPVDAAEVAFIDPDAPSLIVLQEAQS